MVCSSLSFLTFNSQRTIFGLRSERGYAGAVLLHLSIFDLSDYSRWGMWLAIVLLIGVLVGWHPRWSGLVYWWLAFSVFASGVVIEGGEQICTVVALLLVPLALADQRRSWHQPLAFDAQSSRLRDRLGLLSMFLIQTQTTIIYANSALAKLGQTTWLEGTAVYYFMQDSVFAPPGWLRPAKDAFFRWSWGSPLVTWTALPLEILLAVAPWMTSRRVRRTALVAAVCFHGVILIMFGLVSFFFAAIGLNVLALNIWERDT